jgi:hypothetical protein
MMDYDVSMHDHIGLVMFFRKAQAHRVWSPDEKVAFGCGLEKILGRLSESVLTSHPLVFSTLLKLNIGSFCWIALVVIFPTKLVSSHSEFR